MVSLKKLFVQTRPVQVAIGTLAAYYLRLVWKTSRLTLEPTDIYERLTPDLPVIIAMWHGQHYMTPFLRRAEHRATVLISRHRDGEINAIAARKLGVGVIRGSGDAAGQFRRKGGVSAFRAMVAALRDGLSVATTADVPKISRVAGSGVVRLARTSGRAIYPVAVATSHRIELANWDRSAINLPFGRFAIVVGDPIRVAPDADDALLEACRQRVECGLNSVTERAYAVVDSAGKDRRRG